MSFFKQLESSGNFNSTDCNAASVIATSCPITINWDYLNSAKAWGLPGSTHWTVVDPSGTPFGGFYNQAVSKYAPHPAAARLWEEFLYSTQGQNIWLEGGARPVELARDGQGRHREQGRVQVAADGREPLKGGRSQHSAGHDREHVRHQQLVVGDRSTGQQPSQQPRIPRRLGAAGSSLVSCPVSAAGPGSCPSRPT